MNQAHHSDCHSPPDESMLCGMPGERFATSQRGVRRVACAQVCMAIENLYQRVQQVSHIKHSAGIGLLAQAEVVCNYLCDMAMAAKGAPAAAAKAALVAAAHGTPAVARRADNS